MKIETQKPIAKLIGSDGNVFNLIVIASKALKRAGQEEQAKEMRERISNASSYDEALCIIGEYCEIE